MGMMSRVLAVVLSVGIAVYVSTLFVDDFDPAEVQNKNVLITGASSGIGEQMAYQFAKMGANLILTARREHLLKQVIAECNKLSSSPEQKHVYITADMSRMEDTTKVIKFVEDKFGGLDILVLNHALLPLGLSWHGGKENLTRLTTLMDVNFESYVHLASHALPSLARSGGKIAVVTSTGGYLATPYTSAYTASKYALQGFFGVLRQELILNNTGVSITMCIVSATNTEAAVESFKGLFGTKWMNIVQAVDPEIVALEIAKATVTRKYSVSTSTDIQTKLALFIRTLSPEIGDALLRYGFQNIWL